jgi:hypothetical protein
MGIEINSLGVTRWYLLLSAVFMPHVGIAAGNAVCWSINRTFPDPISGNNYPLYAISGDHGNRCWQFLLLLLRFINRIVMPVLAMVYTSGCVFSSGTLHRVWN